MNQMGFAQFIGIMIALVFIICALAFMLPLKQFTDAARNASTDDSVGLDCTNSTISNFDKANCLFVDYQAPLFIGSLIFIGGIIIAAKIVS